MESKRFDALTRGLAGVRSRRGVLRGALAGVAALVGGRSLEQAEAAGTALVTIHNASCGKQLSGQSIYNACHGNGFGCVDFTIRSKTVRTNARGRVSATVRSGQLTISQQTNRVTKSTGIYVFCAAQSGGETTRVLFKGRADAGQVTVSVRTGENVVCDWYNISTKNLALPGQCPAAQSTTTTTTTTPRPCTVTVEPGDGTLQVALDAASDGDVLCLGEGIYADTVRNQVADVNANVTIWGVGPKTVLYAPFIYAFSLNTTCTVRDLKVDGGGNGPTGIYIDTVTGVVLDGVIVTGTGDNGILADGSSVTLRNSVLRNGAGGSGLSLRPGAIVAIEGTVIENWRTSSYGSAIYAGAGATVTMDSMSILRNNVASVGSTVYLEGASFTSNGGTITSNTSVNGGAVTVNGGSFTSVGGAITQNMATAKGGIGNVGGSSSTMTVSDSTDLSGNVGIAGCNDVLMPDTTCCDPRLGACSW